jgi:hypothetical protein
VASSRGRPLELLPLIPVVVVVVVVVGEVMAMGGVKAR